MMRSIHLILNSIHIIRINEIYNSKRFYHHESKNQADCDLSKKKVNGFTLAEALCGLLCSIVVFELCLLCLHCAVKLTDANEDRQIQFAILQLREETALSNYCYLDQDELVLKRGESEFRLGYKNHRIAKTPGYEIFLEGIEEGEFYEEDGWIWVHIVYQNRRMQWQIIQTKEN